MGRIKSGWIQLGWSFQLLIWFLISLLLAWHLLASGEFMYKYWYDWLNIDQTIAKYAPANPIKPDFELTDETERVHLFATIVDAVQNHGAGLGQIVYHDAHGKVLGTLLTEAEIVHLQDVANLVSVSNWLAIILAGIAIAWLLLVKITGWNLPSFAGAISSLAVVLMVAIILVVVIGPVTVFYQLHELIFPAGHQWFFYYEESLMSLLMKAPDLFAPIAIMLLVLAAVFTNCIWYGVHKFLHNGSM